MRRYHEFLGAILTFFVFGLLVGYQAEAEGGPFKGLFKKKNRSQAESVSEATPETDSETNTTAEIREPPPASTEDMRHALLISVPKHAAEIPREATVAFIEFRHIEEEIRFGDPHSFGASVETKEETVTTDGSRILSEVQREAYTNEVCAAQVEYALSQHLADLNRFKVVTRDHIQTVLDEQELSYSGSADSTSAVELGELLGARMLVYGQVQLCVSNKMELQQYLEAATILDGMAGKAEELIRKFLDNKKPVRDTRGAAKKLRAFVLAQIQLIDAETGGQIFTTSLRGEYLGTQGTLDFEVTHRELISHAADHLANSFIDKFLARREGHYVNLHREPWLNFDKGIDLIHLGDCRSSENYFNSLYALYKDRMNTRDLARLMHNHGVSLMCSNRPEDALSRLWASLRLSADEATIQAIELTNETVDRGREIVTEDDPIILEVRDGLYTGLAASPYILALPPDAKPELGLRDQSWR